MATRQRHDSNGRMDGRHTVFDLDKLDQGWAEIVPESTEGVTELIAVDGAGAVSVEVAEYVLPVLLIVCW